MIKNKFNEYKVLGNKTEIYVKQRNSTLHKIIIDTVNLDKLKEFGHKWHVQWHNDTKSYYAHCTFYLGTFNGKPKYKNVTIQTILFQTKENEMLDHINHDTLDNRENNIRKSVRSENLKNRKSKNSNNTSGYRNVTRIGDMWRVQLQVDGKNKLFPEKFEDVHEAGSFAKEMRYKYYGEFSGND